MAIAFDTAVDGGTTGSFPATWSHTCSGSNRMLFVFVSYINTGTISGITYNGVALTKIGSQNVGGASGATDLWYLVNPSSGSNTVSVSGSGSGTNGFASSSYTGVVQASPIDSSITKTQTIATFNITTTTIANNCWTISAITAGNNLSAGTGTVIRTIAGGVAASVIVDSNSAITPAGSTSLQVTSSSTPHGAVMASFAPIVIVPNTSSAFFDFI